MVRLEIELEDVTNDYQLETIVLPCNLRSTIDLQHEYVIVSCDPDIPIYGDDVQKLNDILDEINCENPEMTAEYIQILMEAAGSADLFDEEVIRRIKENDFLFSDLTDISEFGYMSNCEKAARYIASEMKVPFDKNLSKQFFQLIQDSTVVEYIDWDRIWNQYELIGFKLIESDIIENGGLYLVHWRA